MSFHSSLAPSRPREPSGKLHAVGSRIWIVVVLATHGLASVTAADQSVIISEPRRTYIYSTAPHVRIVHVYEVMHDVVPEPSNLDAFNTRKDHTQ